MFLAGQKCAALAHIIRGKKGSWLQPQRKAEHELSIENKYDNVGQ
jgi:hypothetical protein